MFFFACGFVALFLNCGKKKGICLGRESSNYN